MGRKQGFFGPIAAAWLAAVGCGGDASSEGAANSTNASTSTTTGVPDDDPCTPLETMSHTFAARIIDGQASLVHELPERHRSLIESDDVGGLLLQPSHGEPLHRFAPDGTFSVATDVTADLEAFDGANGRVVFVGLGESWQYGALDTNLAYVWGPRSFEERYPDSVAVAAGPDETAALAFVEYDADTGSLWALGADGLPVWEAQWPAFEPPDPEQSLRVRDVFVFDSGAVALAFTHDDFLKLEGWGPDGQPLWSFDVGPWLDYHVPVIQVDDRIVVFEDVGGSFVHQALTETGDLSWQLQESNVDFEDVLACADRFMFGERVFSFGPEGQLVAGDTFESTLSGLDFSYDETHWSVAEQRLFPRCLPDGGFLVVGELTLSHAPPNACEPTGHHDGSGG